MNSLYLVIMFDMLSQYAMRLNFTHVHPAVTAWMRKHAPVTLGGVTFKTNDTNILIKSSQGKLVGEIQGLSGISPRKSLILKSEDPALLLKIKGEVIYALQLLLDSVSFQEISHKAPMPPVVVANKGPTNPATKEFIDSMKPKLIESPTPYACGQYSNL